MNKKEKYTTPILRRTPSSESPSTFQPLAPKKKPKERVSTPTVPSSNESPIKTPSPSLFAPGVVYTSRDKQIEERAPVKKTTREAATDEYSKRLFHSPERASRKFNIMDTPKQGAPRNVYGEKIDTKRNIVNALNAAAVEPSNKVQSNYYKRQKLGGAKRASRPTTTARCPKTKKEVVVLKSEKKK